MNSESIAPPDPGTPAYLPGLVARTRSALPDLPLEPVILQSLLLCLIAQPRLPVRAVNPEHTTGTHVGLHLILRTKEEDVGLVVNLVTLTLQHILGITTHKHKVAPKVRQTSGGSLRNVQVQQHTTNTSAQVDHPDAFLRLLFFRRIPHTSFSSHRSSTPRSRVDATPRSGHVPLPGASKSPRKVGHAPQRSSSFPAPSTDGEDEDHYFDAASLASSRRPLLAGQTPGSTMRSRASRGRPANQRLRTDPLPLSSLFTPPGVTEADELAHSALTSPDSMRPQKSIPNSERGGEHGGTASALPKAVVVSGLEHSATPSQRALMRVLTERRVVFDGDEDDGTDFSERSLDDDGGTWNLPEGFMMVYVCKLDPHERPTILRGLLDKFSMSADVNLQPSVRQSYLAYRTSHTPTPRGTPIPSPLALPHPYFAAPTAHHSPARRPTPLPAPTPIAPSALPISELNYLRTLARPYPVAAPIFYPSIHATTQGTVTAPLPHHPPPYTALHPSLDMYLLDLFAATRHHPALDGTLLTMRAHMDAEALARAFRVLNGDTIGATLVCQEARLGDADTAAFDGGSWTGGGSAAWRSAESLGGMIRSNEAGSRLGVGKGSDEYGYEGEHGIRVRVDDEDGGSHRSFSAGFEGAPDAPDPELAPADALDAAIKSAWPDVWDVSEEDVARIFPRVVSHRLRVRDGPDDEVLSSVVWPACSSDGATEPAMEGRPVSEAAGADGTRLGWERKTVKELLVRILADV